MLQRALLNLITSVSSARECEGALALKPSTLAAHRKVIGGKLKPRGFSNESAQASSLKYPGRWPCRARILSRLFSTVLSNRLDHISSVAGLQEVCQNFGG